MSASQFKRLLPRDKKTNGIIGTKDKNNSNFKGAVRVFDLYIGNCFEGVSSQILTDYISEECDIKIKSCSELNTKIPNSKAFKISVMDAERDILLKSDIWPKNIICRKYYKKRTS